MNYNRYRFKLERLWEGSCFNPILGSHICRDLHDSLGYCFPQHSFLTQFSLRQISYCVGKVANPIFRLYIYFVFLPTYLVNLFIFLKN